MESLCTSRIRPKIIIHGGAGNITRSNLPPDSYHAYRSALLNVLHSASSLLHLPGAKALDVAVHAVSLLENNPLFNAGKGAVFTRNGTIELEASVMVSNGYHKRGVGCMLVKKVKNPIQLAREMLVRGEDAKGGGAQAHCQLSGEYLEGLAEEWGLEMVDPQYFFTRKRWDEHKRGLEREKGLQMESNPNQSSQEQVEPKWKNDDPSWDGKEYLPQGTVGAVVLDSFGTVCVATSTGGLTNKLPGRIGDTPTLGAGFWAEEWFEESTQNRSPLLRAESSPMPVNPGPWTSLTNAISSCLSLPSYQPVPPNKQDHARNYGTKPSQATIRHAVAMSGTGNGDSFLRTSAVRTTAAMSRFSSPCASLSSCVTRMAGPDGELQLSAGDRWEVTGEGQGGIIGIELVGYEGQIVWDLNCGGMFRAWVDEKGNERFLVFRGEY